MTRLDVDPQSQAWQRIRRWLVDEIEMRQTRLEHAGDFETVRYAQGRIAACRDLLAAVEERPAPPADYSQGGPLY